MGLPLPVRHLEALKAELYEQTGQLQVELDWLKKKAVIALDQRTFLKRLRPKILALPHQQVERIEGNRLSVFRKILQSAE
jgi:hypothetical protein